MVEMEMLDELDIDNLFVDDETLVTPPDETLENKEKELETTEINVDDLFTTESESVGSENEKDNEEQESTTPSEKGTSPKNFYSSTAAALKDSIFPDLNIEGVTDADKFADSFEELVQNRLTEKLKRIEEALNNGVAPSAINQYENAINYLSNIDAEQLSGEDLNSENLRKNLIYRDLMNRGYSEEEAREEVSEVFNSGNDVKRAERALKSNLNFYKSKYNETIENARLEAQREAEERKAQAEALKNDILSDNKVFGDVDISKFQRQRAFDVISKPVYKDPKTGDTYTEIQKYESEHRQEFLKKVGLLYVLTDNFTNLEGLIKGKVNKESRKAIRELENTLNNTHRNSDGNLSFVSGVNEDPESILTNYALDL